METKKSNKSKSKSKEKFLPLIPKKGLNDKYIERHYKSAKFRNLVDKEKIKQVTNKVDEYMQRLENIENKDRLIKLEEIEGKKPEKKILTEEEIQKFVISRLYSVKADDKAKEKIKKIHEATKAKKKKKDKEKGKNNKNNENKDDEENDEDKLEKINENLKEDLKEKEHKKKYNTIKQNIFNTALNKNPEKFIKPVEPRRYFKKVPRDVNLTKVHVPRVLTAISRPKGKGIIILVIIVIFINFKFLLVLNDISLDGDMDNLKENNDFQEPNNSFSAISVIINYKYLLRTFDQNLNINTQLNK